MTKIARGYLFKASDLVRRELLDLKSELHAARALLKEHLATQEALREELSVYS